MPVAETTNESAELPPDRRTPAVRWLVTVDASAEDEQLLSELASVEAYLNIDRDPAPLPPDELILFVDGPRDLPDKIGPATPHLRAVYPDADRDLFYS